jgi:hypothetical protein
MKSFGCADIKMYEMEFIEMAKSSSKVSLVLKHFNHKWISGKAYSDAEMITMLQESNDDTQKKLVQNYIQENLSRII